LVPLLVSLLEFCDVSQFSFLFVEVGKDLSIDHSLSVFRIREIVSQVSDIFCHIGHIFDIFTVGRIITGKHLSEEIVIISDGVGRRRESEGIEGHCISALITFEGLYYGSGFGIFDKGVGGDP
jgi:hypothetical protein